MLVRDLIGIIDDLAPFRLALDWDNPGLQCGDPGAALTGVAFCLDPTLDAMGKALGGGANALVSHHPLIFKELKSLPDGNPELAALLFAVRNGLAVISAHTNWDAAGMAPALAGVLGLKSLGFLEAAPLRLLKLVAFVPAGHEDRVSEAVFAAGAGHVGNYSKCSFQAPGTGTFLPGEGANPAIGSQGELEKTPETRFEALVPPKNRDRVAQALRASHPYEEPAFEFQETALDRAFGFGLLGEWDPPREPLSYLAKRLGTPAFPVAGRMPKTLGKVALMPGSGGSYARAAKALGAGLLITGDLGHHQALLARDLGICVASLGHHETESPGVAALRREVAERLGPGIKTFLTNDGSPIEIWAGGR
ncbi:MAG: Nif3-like dinuclear metal center hexameric protein [Deltaproteobacteria bacterium]|jgi:dinuclear metal center YbgI/SA1388 family protein|nr:Nif3-like dinuclear metal center hexameric protein [Deltaproteobacteria bacterium]